MSAIKAQIIEDGHNTSYISSLITSLFYRSSNIMKVLNVNPRNKKFVFIQEFIREKFSGNLQRGFSVHSGTINEFRNYINTCGWQCDIDEMMNEHDISDLYTYLMTGIFGTNNIVFQKLHDGSEEGDFGTFFIDIPIPDGDKGGVVNLTDLFKSWINRNITMNKEYTYKMKRYFNILPIKISRNPNSEKKNRINIMKHIKMFDICDNDQKNLVWTVHSLICHKKEIGYYSIINSPGDEGWLLLSDKSIPSIKKINMKSKKDIIDISENVVMVFYKCYENH